MADEAGSMGMTQIIVSVIGVTGVIVAALFGNWDKLFPKQASQPPSTQVMTASQSIEPPRPAVNIPAASMNAVIDIGGDWHDGDGYAYAIDQQGDRFSYRQLSNGVQQGSGQGQISGSLLRYTYLSAGGAGACEARIDPIGATIAGTCSSGGQSWGFTIVRG